MVLRKGTRRALLIVAAALPAILLAGTGAAGQAFLRWTDAQGGVHFTDDPGTIPKEHREKIGEETPPARRPSTQATPAGPPAQQHVSPAAAPPEAGPEGGADAPAQTAADEAGTSPQAEALRQERASVDNLGNDKQYWQERRAYWEVRLETSEALYRAAKREFGLTNQRYDKREYRKLKALRERMRALEADIAEAKAMLGGGLAREARRAGAEPGWVR